MKKVFTLITVLLAAAAVFAQTTKTSTGNGNWDAAIWNTAGAPTSGSSSTNKNIVEIAAGTTVEVNVNVALNNVDIKVYGTLLVRNNRNIGLNSSCIINVFTGGQVTSQSGNANSVITINSATKFRGDYGSINGPAFSSATTADAAGGNQGFNFGSLPVFMKDFNVFKTTNGQVKMTWITNHETNSQQFDIEKSSDGKNWNTIGSVQAVGGTSIDNYYYFVDNSNVVANTFYRLKQVDRDGKYTYSATRNLKFAKGRYNYMTYPNPSRDAIAISFGAELKEAIAIRVFSPDGQEMQSVKAAKGSNLYRLDISKLPAGNYFLQMVEENGTTETLRFNKQ
jgi:hypothetical protein